MIREDPAVLAYVRRAVRSRPGGDGYSWPTVDDIMEVTARSWPVHGRLDMDDRVLPTSESEWAQRAEAREWRRLWGNAPISYYHARPTREAVRRYRIEQGQENLRRQRSPRVVPPPSVSEAPEVREDTITLSWERGAERPADYQPPSRTWADIDAEEQAAIRQQRLREGR